MSDHSTPPARSKRWLSRLRQDESGLAFLEFALCLPVFMALSMYGVELAYLTTVDMRISQAALTLANNASRLGQTETTAISVQVRESDVLTVFRGLETQMGQIDLKDNGRVILSSLERNGTGGQYIRWQRCFGEQKVPSLYGQEGTGASGTSFPGMGAPGKEITAAAGDSIMFVEINYRYQSIFGDVFVKDRSIRSEAAYNSRDNRQLNAGLANDVAWNQKAVCKV